MALKPKRAWQRWQRLALIFVGWFAVVLVIVQGYSLDFIGSLEVIAISFVCGDFLKKIFLVRTKQGLRLGLVKEEWTIDFPELASYGYVAGLIIGAIVADLLVAVYDFGAYVGEHVGLVIVLGLATPILLAVGFKNEVRDALPPAAVEQTKHSPKWKPPRWYWPLVTVGFTFDFAIFVLAVNHYGLLDAKSAFTLVVVEVPIALLLSYLLPYFVEQRRQVDIQDRIEKRKELKSSLRGHYGDVIGRMESWEYWPNEAGEMIRPKQVQTTVVSGLVSKEEVSRVFENDKSHLKEFQECWNLYSEGHQIYRNYDQARQDSASSVESTLRQRAKKEGVRIPSWESSINSFRDAILSQADSYLKAETEKGRPTHRSMLLDPPTNLTPWFTGNRSMLSKTKQNALHSCWTRYRRVGRSRARSRHEMMRGRQ